MKRIIIILILSVLSFNLSSQDFIIVCENYTLNYVTGVQTYTFPDDIFSQHSVCELRIYLSEDTILDETDDYFLDHIILQTTDDSFHITIDFEFEGYIFYVVDYYDRIHETNEYNNIDFMPISVSDNSTKIKKESSRFDIYPNPTSTILFLSNIYSVDIYNLQGKLIQHDENQHSIDVSSLVQGYYIVKCYNQSGTVITTKKILKIDK